MRSTRDLVKVARDMFDGKIFSSDMLGKDMDMLGTVFMPIILMEEPDLEALRAEAAVIYEYYDCALPRVINGYPIFPSFHYLSQEERVLVKGYYDLFAEARAMGEKAVAALVAITESVSNDEEANRGD